jgi:hypothetical protein
MYRVSPRAGACGEVSATRIPFNISHTVVVGSPEGLDPGRISRALLLAFLSVEIEIPEL